MTFNRTELEESKAHFAAAQRDNELLRSKARDFLVEADYYNYAYQWTWCDLPILQMPQDVLITQEILSKCRPSVVIETGVAWGGGIALYASTMDWYGGRQVIGIDLNLAETVIDAINALSFKTPVSLLKGSSTDESIVNKVTSLLQPGDTVMLVLDSDHSHQHVREELQLLAGLVTPGQYCVVSDTIVEFMPEQSHRPRPWGPGNNPMTAVWDFLESTHDFRVDTNIDDRVLVSFSPGGYLVRAPRDG